MSKEDKILIIDDELMPRASLKMVLKDKYSVFTAEDGKDGLNLLVQIIPDLVILDIKMPDMDGITVLREIKKIYPSIEVILLTAHATIDSAKNAVTLGAFDYLMKPFDKDDLLKVVEKGLHKKRLGDKQQNEHFDLKGKAIYLEEQIAKAQKNLMYFYEGTVKALIRTIDAKDHYTFNHSENVANISYKIGEKLGLSENTLEKLKLTPIIHDIGKIGIEEAVLRKKGPLTAEELKIIRTHPNIGAKIVQPIPFLEDMIPVILYHHEKFDGTGYPTGLKEEEIPLVARIVAVADAIDAMMNNRPYRDALTKEKVISELIKGAGSQFDPEIVNIVLKNNILN